MVVLVSVLVALAIVGWLVTDSRMEGMDAGPGTDLGAFGFFVVSWVVMMAAMMFPSVAPTAGAYDQAHRRRAELGQVRGEPGSTGAFVSGYLVSWVVYGVVAYLLFELLRSLSIDAFSWQRGGPYLAGAIIAAAAVYQLTPMKDACLTKCRGPAEFVGGRWRDGYVGALSMGIEHGSWCIGCCWALMAALFAVGVMSVGWMLFIAALIAAERLLPWRKAANRGVALVLIVLGLGVALWADRVPGLTLPHSSEAAASMHSMGMDGDR
jgi:predicted metal-binding membrane protein